MFHRMSLISGWDSCSDRKALQDSHSGHSDEGSLSLLTFLVVNHIVYSAEVKHGEVIGVASRAVDDSKQQCRAPNSPHRDDSMPSFFLTKKNCAAAEEEGQIVPWRQVAVTCSSMAWVSVAEREGQDGCGKLSKPGLHGACDGYSPNGSVEESPWIAASSHWSCPTTARVVECS